jgi:hypothetical protein
MKPMRDREIERLLDRQARLWETGQTRAPVEADAPRPNLAFSQRPFSGARELAESVARRVGWQIFDRQILEALHRSDDLGKSVLESLDERSLNYREDWLYHLFVPDHVSSPGYVQRLSRLLFSLAIRGQGIFIGRGSSFVIPEEHRLSVLVLRNFENRLARWQEANPNRESGEARRNLTRLDRERAEFIWRSFHRVVDDPLAYDLCVNLDSLDVEAATTVVVEALRARYPQAFGSQSLPSG